MEKYPIEEGYTLVISEKLANAGYEESMVKRKEGSERYVKIPQELHEQDVVLPPSISRLNSIQGLDNQYIKIPFDSMPIKILDLERSESLKMKYPGLVSNLQRSIDILTDTNATLTDMLRKYDLQMDELLIVSIKESQIYILL